MASLKCFWIASCLLSVITNDRGVCARAVDLLSRPPNFTDDSGEPASRAGAPRRWRRGSAEATHRERCAELGEPWTDGTRPAPDGNGTVLQLRVRPFSPGAPRALVFPGKTLFSFLRRVYRCWQEKVICRSVRGIQGRMRRDGDVEFVLSQEILSFVIRRAELHLRLSNPQQLDIHPVLPYMEKQDLPTRYSLRSRGDVVELQVDFLSVIQRLQEMMVHPRRAPSLAKIRRVPFFFNVTPLDDLVSLEGPRDPHGNGLGDRVADTLPGLDLGLVLDCRQAGSGVSCGAGGVQLLHTPFMTLYYERH